MPKIPNLLPLMACCTLASAQVYESVDEQGTPVFSDRPSTGGQAIDIPRPNVSDAVEVPPPSAPAPEPALEARPKIEPEPSPKEAEGELIGEKKRKKGKKRKKKRRKNLDGAEVLPLPVPLD